MGVPMQTPLEMRKPAGQGELREVDIHSSNSRTLAEDLRLRQASRILARFPVSVPLALTVARLAYGGSA
ncbi:hypothetical protein MPL3365_30195 [Mesorhizobium plurifarium]|uniref:Uncharacterized protein n=1 Tax=Mesorhizobium plurifarium TaxID=69974 RepID=A0A090G7I7_MESPL|nr:hypothetical protein MPL3365_30195 [Mesorhizobium plurifarium]